MAQKNLATDLLRTFVAVVDEGGFSPAGALLGRSQPAISLQIKRLQEMVGANLLVREGRGFNLTDEGRVLLSYARPMLRLNDEAIARLSKSGLAGVVRLGVPNEYADSFLPDILGRFAQRYPDIAIEVGCELSTHLLAKLERGEYDLVFGLHTDSAATKGASKVQLKAQSWAEKLVWVGSPQHPVQTRRPLPLIVAPQGCVYRQRMLETLEGLGQPWRIAYTSPSFGGIKAGVLAGLGVTVLAASTVPDGLAVLGVSDGMPSLADIRVALHYNQAEASEAVQALAQFMTERLG
ncbi:LysR substrate-binding domain-containing protein [Parvibium lacunae]|uniref:LysR family transcriptional regulator n=1 Tax=Parvibium lacunae TaxID=1888893 RepID=A0A368L298_9BURK|nr:LysR substrate-binding domain-containing protein [Parvibium lacunae]RCS57510.1 LysR family transcriptional regulator [Parvibium lacunae]